MKRKHLLIIGGVLASSVLSSCVPVAPSTPSTPAPSVPASTGTTISGETWTISSPDQKLAMQVVLDDFGQLYYNVAKDGVQVAKDSRLGFVFEDVILNQMLRSVTAIENPIDFTYTNISGDHDQVHVVGTEYILTFTDETYNLILYARAYNDGYAFRYEINARDGSTGELKIEEECTTFAIPEDAIAYVQPYTPISVKAEAENKNCFAYEEAFKRKKITSLDNEYLSMPFIYRVGETGMYSLITESELIGSEYYGTFLKCDPNYNEPCTFQTVHTPAGKMEKDNVISYPFVSPWRLGITGTLEEVVESELVEAVYGEVDYWRPDDYDSLSATDKEIYNYDWVEPGVVAWNWAAYTGTKPQSDWELQRSYVDLAQRMGWKYTILDGGWDQTVNNLKDFCEYASERGVKVIVWFNALGDFSNGSKSLLTAKLRSFANCGIAGIKIDFFDGQNVSGNRHQGEDSDTIRWYETIYQECAKLKLVVNCHGSNKPSGERRVYPNVLNREAIYGAEFRSTPATTAVMAMYTRNIVGPVDFTPFASARSSSMTKANMIALAVQWESGQPSMADFETAYADSKVNSFYKHISAKYDEIQFLGGDPETYYMSAKRSGNRWFVAMTNAATARDVTVSFSFLDSGTYTASVIKDAGDYREIATETFDVTASSTHTISALKYGGFVIELNKK